MDRNLAVKLIDEVVELEVKVDGDPPIRKQRARIIDVGQHNIWWTEPEPGSSPKPTPLGMISAIRVIS